MNQIIMILLVSLLVLVHEIGHFIAARLTGVRVTRFGIGMPIGPSFKLFKLGHTVFYIHAFLFGGYVSFADDEISENKEEITAENKKDEESEETLPKDSPELYENKTISQKLFIVTAGVIMNVIFAVILVIFCAAYYQKLPASTQNIYIDTLSSKITSNIETKGIKKDDKIVKVNDTDITSLYQLTFFAKNSKLFDDYAQKSLVESNLKELKRLNPNIEDNVKENTIVILPQRQAESALKVNKNVLKGLEKYKKEGIELNKSQIELRDEIQNKIYNENPNGGDIIIQKPTTLNDIALAVSDTYKPVKLTVLRNNETLEFNDVKIGKEGMLGILLKVEDNYDDTKTPKDIILKSCNYLYTTTTTMLYSLWQLVSGKIDASDMHGVIAVVKVGGDIIAAKGMLNGILLTAMISINLAIMNFLPIPALDGGHVAFLIFEKITGKKPSQKTSERINNFFFALLMALMVVICYNDIFALVTKKF